MAITPPGDDRPGPIFNTGPGTAIGRDNYGTINAPIDDTTRKLLAKLATEAPDLARLVRRALDEGIVPPGLVYALERAAWAINEDVALMIHGAASSINEDVAMMLLGAARDIKEGADTTERLMQSGTSTLQEAARQLDGTASALAEVQEAYTGNGVVYQLGKIADEIDYRAGIIEGNVAPPPAQIVVNWRPVGWAFVIGLIVGMAFLAVVAQR